MMPMRTAAAMLFSPLLSLLSSQYKLFSLHTSPCVPSARAAPTACPARSHLPTGTMRAPALPPQRAGVPICCLRLMGPADPGYHNLLTRGEPTWRCGRLRHDKVGCRRIESLEGELQALYVRPERGSLGNGVTLFRGTGWGGRLGAG